MNTTSPIKIKITTTDSGCGVKIFAADSNAFTYAVSELKGIIPFAFRNYDPTKKIWLIRDWRCLDEWISELRSVYTVETEYDDEQPSRPPPPNQSLTSPFATLHLLPTAPPEVVKASYKALARIYHPDAKGSHDKMIQINLAFETLSEGKEK
jgi:hypothetical protein